MSEYLPFVRFVTDYVPQDDVASGAAPDGYTSSYVANVAFSFLASGAEKDQL